MEYHIITRVYQGVRQYQIVRTIKGGNPLYGYAGHWEKSTHGFGKEIIFNSYDEAHSYLHQNTSLSDSIIAPQVKPAEVDVLFGILEELKTANHIFASLYLDLKKLLPEDPEPKPMQPEPILGKERME